MEIPDSILEAIISFLEGRSSQSQADELISWLERDNNLYFFRQIEEIWTASHIIEIAEPDIKDSLRKIRNKIVNRNIRSIPSREIRFSIRAVISIAAAILILISLSLSGLILFSGRGKSAPLNSAMIETTSPRGSRSFIMLSDSTTIWLNSDTKLRYSTDYGINNRTVYLIGEAYFKVSRNENLPFQVNTSEIKVTAIGTAFNVKAYNDESTIETTLEEGQVEINLLSPEKRRRSPEPILLKPRQTAVYRKQEGEIGISEKKDQIVIDKSVRTGTLDKLPVKVIEVADTKLYTSWKDPKWIFRNEKFSTLAPKLERRYNIKIQIIDPPVEEYTFTGTLLEESLEQVLAAIQLTSPIRYEINSQEVKLYEDKFLQKQYRSIIEK